MRTSDLVRGKISVPVSDGDDDKTLGNPIEEPSNLGIEKSPSVPSEEQPPKQQMLLDGSLLMERGQNIYTSAVNYLQTVGVTLRSSGIHLNLEQPLRMIEQMITEPSLVEEMYRVTLLPEHGKDYNTSSPVNNMIYCYKIGMRMGYDPFNLTEICLAALHHDIGMFLIPKSIVGKTGELTASELTEIRKHSVTGRDLLRSHDRTYPNLSRAVYEHHERESGQGYPLGLTGDKICEYAKIIGICDSYEAMTHHRPHKKATAQYISVLELAETKNIFFAPHIVKVFLDEFTMYPAGSYVRLNNKAIGVVVETNRNNPFKPIVRIVADGQGNKVSDEQRINLSENAIINIVSGLSEEEIAL